MYTVHHRNIEIKWLNKSYIKHKYFILIDNKVGLYRPWHEDEIHFVIRNSKRMIGIDQYQLCHKFISESICTLQRYVETNKLWGSRTAVDCKTVYRLRDLKVVLLSGVVNGEEWKMDGNRGWLVDRELVRTCRSTRWLQTRNVESTITCSVFTCGP